MPYPAYRDSGVDHFPEVPVAWATPALRELGRFSKGVGGTKDDEVDSGIPCVRYGDLYTQHEMFITETRSYIDPAQAVDYTRSEPGDALFAASGETIEEIGKSAVNLVPGQMRVGGDVILFRPVEPVNARFLGYALESRPAVLQKTCMGKGVTVVHIYPQALRNLRLPLPPSEDQAAIVRYLNYVVSRIQRLIAAKERLIELLEEEKQAIIHRVVTRGLDSDVPTSPSGSAWLGDIPKVWRSGPLKRWTALMDSGAWGSGFSDDGVLVLRSTEQAVDGTWRIEKPARRLLSDSERTATRLRAGDLVITKSSGSPRHIGKTSLVSSELEAMECGFSNFMLRLRCSAALDPRFARVILNSSIARDQFRYLSNTTTGLENLSASTVSAIYIPLPAREEQARIVSAMDRATSDTLRTADLAASQVALLREYRTRLISDVVTGKLDVREAAGRLPAEPELAAPELDEQLEEAIT